MFAVHRTPYGINLDFNPIIKYFDLQGNYILQHWQAKPFGLRNFGYLEVNNNVSRYLTIPSGFCNIFVLPQTLQIDETKNKGKLPTAVMYYENAIFVTHEVNNKTIWEIRTLA